MKKKHIILIKNEYKNKYIIHKFSLIIKAINIHPKLLIEEKVINFRKEVWFKPPNVPIITFKIIIIIKK